MKKYPKQTEEPKEPKKPKKSYGFKYRVIKIRCYEAMDDT